jgi:gliding motility-associated-like protein
MNSFRFSALLFFAIFISTLQTQAQGDDCEDAIQLTNLNKYCSNPQQFTNIGSSPSIWPAAACWPASAVSDVWFWFRATATDVQISVSGEPGKGTIRRPNIELKRGNCGLLYNMACAPQDPSKQVTTLYKGGLTPGLNYFIRVSTAAANRGTFTLCVSNYTPTVNPGADCNGVVKLCDKSQVFVPGLSGGGSNNKEIESTSCFKSTDAATLLESNSSWFKWTCETAGSLTFDITPIDPANDLDFILYELGGTDPCAQRTIIRCSATSCVDGAIGLNMTETDVSEPINCDPPNTGSDGFLKYLDMQAGKSYALMVNNFNTNSGFTINFGGSGVILGPKAVISSLNAASLCKGEHVVYDGNKSQHYDALNWIFTSGNPATATSVGPHKVDYSIPGIYTTYLKASDASCASGNSIDSVKITVNAPPVISVSNAVISNTDCDKSTGSITGITVNGKPTITYEWFTPPATSVSVSTTTPDLIAMPPGEYYLIIRDSTTCKDTTANFEIKKHELPPIPGVSNNIPTCDGSAIGPITATGNGGVYTWFGDADLNDTLHVGPVYTPVNTVTDTLYLTETLHGCSSNVDTVIVIVNPLPTADAGTLKHLVCRLPSVELEGSASGGGALSYSWSPASAIASGGATLKPFVNASGTYTLTVKNDSTGCVQTDEVVVVKDPDPVASCSADVYKGESPLKVSFTNNSTGSNTYVWLLDGKDLISTDKNPSHTYVTPKIYKVLLIASDSNKCPDSLWMEINVYEKFMVEIPNVFTPNGDGSNDIFTINTTGIAEMSGEIYDRWGLKLYSWEQKNGGWDGHSSTGSLAPDGSYFYILRIKPQDGKETYIKAGHLTLLR